MIAGTRESKARTDYLLAKIADKIIRLFEWSTSHFTAQMSSKVYLLAPC